ncbi:MAG TPA: substrate-binding domain-containing protein [Nitrososphaerales archaeon]|nr:substrate-binding domain-containing protein [Nitrososphaerales archaeon]
MKVKGSGISNVRIATVTIVAVVVAVAYAVYTTWGGKTTLTQVSSSTNGSSVPPTPLISFSADAYAAETASLLSGFAQTTGLPVAPVKSGGSFADANQIAAGAPDDVFISVALSATGPRYLKNLSSNWAVGFASDQMVIAYSNATLSSPEGTIVGRGNTAARSNTTSDWSAFFTSLTSGNGKIGISDPVADPAGLRAWLSLEAGGFLYSNGNQGAYATALLQAKANVTGTHAAALVAPLESGLIQFLFIYKSAAVTNHLGYIQLDRHVNLGDPTLGTFYSKLSYRDSAGVIAGAPIILCITVPLSSVNTTEALQFVQYVVKNAWELSSYGLQPFSQARLYNNVSPPAPVAQMISEGLMVEAGNLG